MTGATAREPMEWIMPGFDSAYRDRLVSAETAVATIPNGARICMALGVAQPLALLDALARRAAAGGIEGAALYYLLSTATAGQSVLRRDLNHRLRPMSLFHSAVERALDDLAAQEQASAIDLVPTAFSRAPRLLCDDIGVDTLITQVAPMDENGEFSLGTNVDYAYGTARCARRVIVEVNRNMPRTSGRATIPLSAVTAIVEHDSPLVEVPLFPADRRMMRSARSSPASSRMAPASRWGSAPCRRRSATRCAAIATSASIPN